MSHASQRESNGFLKITPFPGLLSFFQNVTTLLMTSSGLDIVETL